MPAVSGRDRIIMVLFMALLTVTSFFSAEWSKWVHAIVLIFSFLFAFLILRGHRFNTASTRWRSVVSHPHTYMIGWLVIGLAGVFFSVHWYGSLSYWFLLAAYILIYFSAIHFFRTWRHIELFNWGVIGVGVLGALAGFVMFLNQSSPRLSGFLFNANAISGVFILLIPLACIQWIQAERKLYKTIWGLSALTMIVGLALTYSYTAWVSSIIPLYILLRRFHRQIFSRTTVVIMLLCAILGVGGLIGFRYAQHKDLGRAIKIYETISYSDFISSFSQRWNFLVSAIHMAIDHPIIGTGLNTYQDMYARYAETVNEQPRYAHNYYMQAFAELGVFGGAALVAFIILVGRRIIVVIRRETDEHRRGILIGAALGALASATHAAFDFGWHFALVFILFWLMLGVLMAWGRQQTGELASAEADSDRPWISKMISAGVLITAIVVLFRGLTVFMGAYLFDMAERQAQRGEFESAFASYEQGQRFDPDLVVYTQYAGLAITNLSLLTADQRAALEQRLLTLTQRQPEQYRPFWMLGRLYIAQDQYERAIVPLTRATELNPLFLPDIFYDLGFALYSQERYDEAAQVIREYLDVYYPGIRVRNPNLPTQLAALNYLLGEIMKTQRNTARAEYYYLQSLQYVDQFGPAITGLQSLSEMQ
ncbi:MAG: O-antigen ligase family protein [Candidatus Kerfeldbacteria bacterium]|nr:O-antigen ligase family protein [Candidatus Kerfeldbacteria bacterium]